MLGRIYWFTVEFGLVENGRGIKIYGAGVISSHEETKFALSKKSAHIPFDIEKIMNTDFDKETI
jgi:phenylalanine-4-hydroxylase